MKQRALRFFTAGNVDDGKSTLIGRLLYDSRSLLTDQIDELERRAAGQSLDLALLTDGLEAEREQGITIDVAFRYFATSTRKFIIADSPGHEQYTRNMVTAAAGSDSALVLIDVTKLDLQALNQQGFLALAPQTKRHASLARLLRVPNIVFTINKLDAVANPGDAFASVSAAVRAFCAHADIDLAAIVPISALHGHNVVSAAQGAWRDWYAGPTLLETLESLPAAQESSDGEFLMPVQYVARTAEGVGVQPRTLWGRVAHGRVQLGDELTVFPSGERARVAQLIQASRSVVEVQAGVSAGVILDRQLDVSRGDWLGSANAFNAVDEFTATLAWMDTEPLIPGRKYWVRHGNRWAMARIDFIASRLDIHTMQRTSAEQLAVNDIGEVGVRLQAPLPIRPYRHSRDAGAMIVVDPTSHRTSGALLAI